MFMHQLLRQIIADLTPETWNKGSYFLFKNGTMCNCVHGAGQKLVNPRVAAALKNNYVEESRRGFVAAALVPNISAAFDAEFANSRASKSTKDLLTVWNSRPRFVKNNYMDYGNTSLHWLMGMFGITSSFNDAKNTTLEMVKAKLEQAAQWAQANSI